jgi:hypothetical protein
LHTERQRDDLATVIAIAVLAVCTSDVAHEAMGHGGACLLSSGHVTLLNNAFFACSTFGHFVAFSGPLGNLTVGLIAFVAQLRMPARLPGWRLFALLVMSFSLFWEAGYLIEAMIIGSGDSVFAWRDLVGPDTAGVRGVAVLIGIGAYVLFSRMLMFHAAAFSSAAGRVERLLRPAWIAGMVAMALAASLYAPDRLGAMRDAALSVAASFPLLLSRPGLVPAREPAALILRDNRLVALGVTVFILFAATMGQGMSW